MALEIKFEFSLPVGTRRRLDPVIAGMIGKMNDVMVDLARKIQATKLHGQVLQQRTGVLAGSVVPIPARAEGGDIVAGVEAAGGPAYYGEIHERGGSRAYVIYAVNKKALHFQLLGKDYFARFVHHPAIKKRSFMGSTLREERSAIVEALQSALDGLVAGI